MNFKINSWYYYNTRHEFLYSVHSTSFQRKRGLGLETKAQLLAGKYGRFPSQSFWMDPASAFRLGLLVLLENSIVETDNMLSLVMFEELECQASTEC